VFYYIKNLFLDGNDLCFIFLKGSIDNDLVKVVQFEGPVLTVETMTAKKLGIEHGKFYCFHKKSLSTENCASLIE